MQKLSKVKKDLRVLIVDDNPINREILSILMDDILQVSAEVVEDGCEAVEKAMQEFYDVIFMDVFMPNLNGLMASEQIIKQQERNQLTVKSIIIGVTADFSSTLQEACKRAGMYDCFAKPLDARFISEKLKELLHA
jgi:CheY-like chemotaxis protein